MPQEVFFSLTELHSIKLNAAAKNHLKKHYGKLGAQPIIDYKEALNQITIDLDAAGGADDYGQDAELKWTVAAFVKRSAVAGDSVSQLGEGYKYKTSAARPADTQSFLSRDKLQNLNAMNQFKGAFGGADKQSVASTRKDLQSIAPSQMKAESQISKRPLYMDLEAIKTYMRNLSNSERESFERLLQVLRQIKTEANPDATVTPGSIFAVRTAVADFVEKRGRRMSLEQLIEICKLHVTDFKVIDQIC